MHWKKTVIKCEQSLNVEGIKREIVQREKLIQRCERYVIRKQLQYFISIRDFFANKILTADLNACKMALFCFVMQIRRIVMGINETLLEF